MREMQAMVWYHTVLYNTYRRPPHRHSIKFCTYGMHTIFYFLIKMMLGSNETRRRSVDSDANDMSDAGSDGAGDANSHCPMKKKAKILQLVENVCEAMEEGNYSQLPSLLNFSSASFSVAAVADNDIDGDENIHSPLSPECRQLRRIFHASVGGLWLRNESQSHDDDSVSNDMEIPMTATVKSHLLLRALLHLHHRQLSWEAAFAAVQSLQYAPPHLESRASTMNNIAEQEMMAMISEIRQFVIAIVRKCRSITNSISYNSLNNNNDSNYNNNSRSYVTMLQYSLDFLLKLGHVIIAPLLSQKNQPIVTDNDDFINIVTITNGNYNKMVKRERSYLLPLELIPLLLASLDSLDDSLAHFLLYQQKEEQRQQRQQEEIVDNEDDYSLMNDFEKMTNDTNIIIKSKINNDDNDVVSNESSKRKHPQVLRHSDILLSTMFVSGSSNSNSNNKAHKSKNNVRVRGNAILPLLALAIDDVGFDRMAMSVPKMLIMTRNNNSSNDNGSSLNDEDISYWDCLKLSLHHIIQSNLTCYYAEENEKERGGGKALDDDDDDEGDYNYLIAPSDYPALIRCVFRMILTNSSSSSTSSHNRCTQQFSSIKWESLLLQLYHAAAVVSAKSSTVFQRLQRQRSEYHQYHSASAVLSTVENHVLLPSFTGASVMAIRSVLDVCLYESCCCDSCKSRISSSVHNKTTWSWWSQNGAGTIASSPPNWAIAGIVILIMRARSSNLSNNSMIGGSSFGPRAVFRIAADIMRMKASVESSNNNSNKGVDNRKQIGLGSDDEVGYALTVLLALRGGGEEEEESERCLPCSGERQKGDACALDVLKNTYYAGNGLFRHKYLTDEEKETTYEYHLGHRRLTQYANLVCSSLNQGELDNAIRTKSSESSISETAKTWVDAAFMLLDEMSNTESKEKECTTTSRKANDSTPNASAIALTIIVVVFYEVPPSQHEIVRSVYDRLINSSSRSNQSTLKRKQGEKCFILASLLAWSLVASFEKNSSLNNVVRRKCEKGCAEEAKAVLGPLCNLLIAPAPVCDVFLDTDKPSLSYWALKQLARSLVPISSGREAILAMAKKHLRSSMMQSPYYFTSAQVVRFSESMPSTSSATRDALSFAVYCLCTLIERNNPLDKCFIPDEYGSEALNIISDIIASRSSTPCVATGSSSSCVVSVPQIVTSRLLQELITSVKHSRLNEWVSQRLLRSCLVTLIAFFESDDKVRPPVLMIRRVFRATNNGRSFQTIADVVNIFRLAMTIQSFIDDEGGAFGSFLKLKILPVLLPKGFRINGRNDDEGDEKLNSENVNRTCLAFLLQGVAKTIRCDTVESIDINRNVTHYMMHEIVQAEQSCYRNENKQRNSIPSWLERHHSPPISTRYDELPEFLIDILKMSEEFKLFHASLCSIVIEALLNSRDKLVEDYESQFKFEILRGLHLALKSRRRMCSDEVNASSNSSLQDGTSGDTHRRLLELSSQHLQSLLLSNAALTEIDLVLGNILNLFLESSTRLSISSTLKLYSSLADEKTMQSLLSCIRYHYYNVKDRVTVKANEESMNSSLLSIPCPDESIDEHIDEHVRSVRHIILTKISSNLTSLAASKAFLSLEERAADLSSYLQLLLKLCKDWRAAFDGLSGRISNEIYEMFLETADKCTDAIASYIDNLPERFLFRVKDSFVSVFHSISAVWTIFRKEWLRNKANRITGTLRLCIDKMPQLLRRVERLLGENIVDDALGDHSVTLLKNCLLHLKIEPASHDKSHVTVAEKDISEKTAACNRNGDRVLASKTGVPSFEEEGEEYEFDIHDEGPNNMLNVSSESVPWIYNCVFRAFQRMWSDYYKSVSRGEIYKRAVASSRERSTNLSQLQRRELSSSLTAVFLKLHQHHRR